MKKRADILSILFVAVLLFFALFLCWYLPSMSSLRFRYEDTQLSLETSRGRENKQQYEYDEVFAQLPLVQEELLQKAPQASEAESEVDALKARKKELRAARDELEQQLSALTSSQEGESHEK